MKHFSLENDEGGGWWQFCDLKGMRGYEVGEGRS